MGKKWLWIGLAAICLVFSFSNMLRSRQNLNRAQELLDSRPYPPEYLPKGAIVAYGDYKGISGKIYKIPILSDGKGGQSRWLADVLWADLPIEQRMKFAAGRGGHLCVQDLLDMWEKFGEWKRTGKDQGITIVTYDEGEKPCPK